jgi:hypothetical protein
MGVCCMILFLRDMVIGRTQKFGKFYKLVAECLGLADIFVNEHDRIIFHSDKLDVSTSVCM